jgi:hypothetical protein
MTDEQRDALGDRLVIWTCVLASVTVFALWAIGAIP